MGLDCSHEAFHGSYSLFNRFRQAVCYVIGGSYPPHLKENYLLWGPREPDDELWYWGHGFSEETHPGLHLFLSHSDCDGELTPEECLLVATDLEPLIPLLQWLGGSGDYAEVCQQFIDGCRLAAKNNEILTFR